MNKNISDRPESTFVGFPGCPWNQSWSDMICAANGCTRITQRTSPVSPTIVVTMRLLALLPTLGRAAQILAVALSSDKDANEMSLAESDAAVAEFFAKLEPATKWTVLHDITGPEAGADVCSMSPT